MQCCASTGSHHPPAFKMATDLSDDFCFSFRVKEKPQTQRRKTTSRRRSTGSVRRRDARPRTQCVLRARQRGECSEIYLEGRASSVLNQSNRLCPSSPPQVCQKRIHVSLVPSVMWGTFLQRMFRSLLQKVKVNWTFRFHDGLHKIRLRPMFVLWFCLYRQP